MPWRFADVAQRGGGTDNVCFSLWSRRRSRLQSFENILEAGVVLRLLELDWVLLCGVRGWGWTGSPGS